MYCISSCVQCCCHSHVLCSGSGHTHTNAQYLLGPTKAYITFKASKYQKERYWHMCNKWPFFNGRFCSINPLLDSTLTSIQISKRWAIFLRCFQSLFCNFLAQCAGLNGFTTASRGSRVLSLGVTLHSVFALVSDLSNNWFRSLLNHQSKNLSHKSSLE